jgi:hypothetical protein
LQDGGLEPIKGGVVDIGWAKKKGVAKCTFCDEDMKYYSFRCPDGGAAACNPCKNKLSCFTPPEPEVEDGVKGMDDGGKEGFETEEDKENQQP